MVLDIEMALVVHRQILRTVVQDRHIGIPLDIVDLRIVRHKVVDDGEHEVLHLGIGHIEHHLRTTTTQHGLTLRSLDDPFRVGLVEF